MKYPPVYPKWFHCIKRITLSKLHYLPETTKNGYAVCLYSYLSHGC